MAAHQRATVSLGGSLVPVRHYTVSPKQSLQSFTESMRPGRSTRRSPSARKPLITRSTGGTSVSPADVSTFDIEHAARHQPTCQSFDFLVIGSGIAGLTYALKVAQFGTVAVVSLRFGPDIVFSWYICQWLQPYTKGPSCLMSASCHLISSPDCYIYL